MYQKQKNFGGKNYVREKRVLAAAARGMTIVAFPAAAQRRRRETTSGAGDTSDTTVEESTRASAAVAGKDYGGKSFDIFVSGNWDNEVDGILRFLLGG
ncbi:MAG: hypothetical protein ACLR5G_00805 [Eubacteriales bacterium]